MVSVQEVIVVEGRYDKNALSQVVDATILTTEGFGVFKDAALRAWLLDLARTRGIVVLTDGDGAGFVIRNHLKSFLPPERVLHAYVPDIKGRERRKRTPSREGKLGVEGMPPDVLLDALRRAGATLSDGPARRHVGITKADLYAWGLSGRPESAVRRRALQRKLGLPERLTADGLLVALSLRFSQKPTDEEIARLLEESADPCGEGSA